MANKTIDALVYCPFYIREAKNTITCEGVIGSETVNRFDTEREKTEHEKNFCTEKTCRGCALHWAIMQNYPPTADISPKVYRC